MASIRRTTVALAMALGLAATAQADVLALITKVGNPQPFRGMVRWQAASRQYMVTVKQGDVDIVLKMSPSEVEKIQVQEPETFKAVVAAIQRGQQYQQAIPALEKIMSDYMMLEWDAKAGRWLVECHMKLKEPAKAVTVAEKAIEGNPAAALSPDMAPLYWDALIATDQWGKLRAALTEAAQKGDRELAAVAQIKRGDMARKQGNLKDALVDGYLRTAYFFQQVKAVQPEALFKAAQCFDELGQRNYAEAMRKRLLGEFPQDPYAEKARTGAGT